jgi:Tfp pilus assembly protein PilO
MRNRLTLLMAVLLAIDVALVAYLLWPGTSNKEVRHEEEQKLQQELAQKTRDNAPLHGIENKLTETRANIKKFYAQRVVNQSSQISNELHRLAQESGISLQTIHYKADPSGLPNLERVNIETAVAGDYLKIAHFINALERDKLLFIIDQIALSAPPGGLVQLQIKFETFMKEAA